MNEPIRVGIAGGNWGRTQATAFREIEGVSLAAIAEKDDDLRNELVDTFGFGNSYERYEEMILSGGLDALVACLPADGHERATSAGFDADLHVLCESPPAINESEMSRVVSAAGFCGKVYMWGRHSRFDPRIQRARKLVADGALGEVYRAEAIGRLAWWPYDDNNWRGSRERGGGALLDRALPLIDDLWYSMDCPDPMEAMAARHSLFLADRVADPSDVAEDSFFGNARFKNGASLSVSSTSFGHIDAPPNADGIPERRNLALYGTLGSLDLVKGTIARSTGSQVTVEPYAEAISEQAQIRAQAQEFIDAIREEREPLNNGKQGLSLMKLLDAFASSAKEKKAMPIKVARSLDDLFGGL